MAGGCIIVGSRAIAGSMFYKLSAWPHRATAAQFTNLADRVEINPQERVTCSTDKDRRGGCHASQSICGAGFRKNAEWGSITSPSYGGRKMPSRPKDWQKIINAEAEVCHWIAPDGTRHPCTDEENAEVRRELLMMRTISDKRRQQKIAER